MKVNDVPINKIQITDNIRVSAEGIASLMESIKQEGLKEPIGVMVNNKGYVLLYGYRRLISYKKLGYRKIPAVIWKEKLEIADKLIVNAIENIQRLDISPIELGRVCKKLHELGLSIEEISARLGIKRGRITLAMGAYRIPEKHKERVKFVQGSTTKKGDISATLAYRILQLKKDLGMDAKTTEFLFDIARKEALTIENMKVITLLVKNGSSVEEALEERSKYVIFSVDVLFSKEEVEKLASKEDLPYAEVVRKIVYGELPHLTRPAIHIMSHNKKREVK